MKEAKKKPEEEADLKKEFNRKVANVHKFLKDQVLEEYQFRMITTQPGVVWLKKIIAGEVTHEKVFMGDDIVCIKRITDYIQDEIEGEIKKEAALA